MYIMEKYNDNQLNYSYKRFREWCKQKVDNYLGNTLRIIFHDGEYLVQERVKFLFISFWHTISKYDTPAVAKAKLFENELNKVYDTGFSIGKYKVARTNDMFFVIKKDHWYSSWQPIEVWNFDLLMQIFEENKNKYHFGIIKADSKGRRAEYEASDAPEVQITKQFIANGEMPKRFSVELTDYSWLIKKSIPSHTIFDVAKRYAELLDETTTELAIKVDLNKTL